MVGGVVLEGMESEILAAPDRGVEAQSGDASRVEVDESSAAPMVGQERRAKVRWIRLAEGRQHTQDKTRLAGLLCACAGQSNPVLHLTGEPEDGWEGRMDGWIDG